MKSVVGLNKIVNQPSVLKGIAPGHSRLDMSHFFDNPGNFYLRRGAGALMFAHAGDGEYEVHVAFPQKMRGKRAVIAATDMVTEAFTRHGARAIYGLTPVDDVAARIFSAACGFRNVGETYDKDGDLCVKYYTDRTEWERF